MNDIDSKLRQQYGQRLPFKVPEGYFEDFQKRIIDEVKADTNRRHRNYRMIFAIAASVIVLVAFSLTLVFTRGSRTDTQSQIAKAVTSISADTQQYINNKVKTAPLPPNNQLAMVGNPSGSKTAKETAISPNKYNKVKVADRNANTFEQKAVPAEVNEDAVTENDQPSVAVPSSSDVDEAADYLMIDDDDLYYVMTETNN